MINLGALNSEAAYRPMPVGINENVELTNVEIGKTQNGADYLLVEFTDGNGRKFTQREWNVEKAYPKSIYKDGAVVGQETEAQAIDREITERAVRVKHIWTKYVDEAVIAAMTFQNIVDVYTKFAASMKGKFEGIKVSIKVLYKYNSSFTEFPKKPGFIELYEEGMPTTLSISQWERDNRMTPAVAEEQDAVNNTDSAMVSADVDPALFDPDTNPFK